MRFWGLIIIAVAILTACTSKKPVETSRTYVVADSFETGPGVVVRALKVDGPYLWVGTNMGILQVDRKTGALIKTFTKDDGLLSSYIFTINVSPSGTRWFGTDAGGLSRYNGEDWKTFMPEDGLADEWVYDIDFDPEGGVWVGTWDGVSRYDGKEFLNYKVSDGLANKWVYGVATDRDGTLWFGTEEGVSHFNPKENTWTTYTHKDGLGAPNKSALARKQTRGEAYEVAQSELPAGRSYEGHFHDLSPMDEEGNDTYNENYIFAITIDRQGNKWFGTWGGGVSRFDGRTWRNFTTEDGLPGNIVYSIEEDSLGQIWVGTHQGASVYDGKSWKSYTSKDGIKGGDVFVVAVDSDQKVWLGQNGRVVQLKEDQG